MSLAVQQDALTSTASDLLTEAGMMLNAGKRVIVYVEGDSDRRLYKNLFRNIVEIIPADNFAKVEATIAAYDTAQDKKIYPLIVGVVDRDYRVAAGQIAANSNLICTELRDIECEMVESQAFHHLLEEYSAEKFRKAWADSTNFKAVIVDATSAVGKVRFFNHLTNAGISFAELDFEKFMDLKRHSVKTDTLINHLRGAQKKGTSIPGNFKDVEKAISDRKYEKHVKNPMRMSRGHDIFDLVSLYLKKGYGRAAANTSPDILESGIRLAFTSCIRNSPTVQKLVGWFEAHHIQEALV